MLYVKIKLVKLNYFDKSNSQDIFQIFSILNIYIYCIYIILLKVYIYIFYSFLLFNWNNNFFRIMLLIIVEEQMLIVIGEYY